MEAKFFVTIGTRVDPTTGKRELSGVNSSLTAPTMGVAATSRIIRVILDIPDIELEIPTLRVAWPGQVTEEIVAEVSDWTKLEPN